MTVCGDPGQVTNAVRNGPSSFTVGSTATYSCSPGFQTIGNAEITCLSSRQWSPRPICSQVSGVGKYLFS